MRNYENLAKNVAQDKITRTTLLTGKPSPTLVSMERKLVEFYESKGYVVHFLSGTPKRVNEVLSDSTLPGQEPVYFIRDVMHKLTDSDTPWVERLLKDKFAAWTVWIGANPTAGRIKAAFDRQMVREYSAGFGVSDAQRRGFNVWVQDVAHCNVRLAQTISRLTDYDEYRAYSVAQKIFFLGDDTTSHDVEVLAMDFNHGPFVETLVSHQLMKASTLAKNVSHTHVASTLNEIADTVRLLGRIYPATQRYTEPNVNGVKMTGIQLPVLHKWWKVAGKYGHMDVARHLLQISSVSERAMTEGYENSALMALVLSW